MDRNVVISSSPSESPYWESNESTSDDTICLGEDGEISTRDSRLSSSQEKAGNTYGRSFNPGGGPSQLLVVGELQDGDAGDLRGERTTPMSVRRSSSFSFCLRPADLRGGICLDLGSWYNARASRNAECHASMCLNCNIWCH